MGMHVRFRLGYLRDRLRDAFVGVPMECRHQYPLAGRSSPREALSFPMGNQEGLVCYGRPSANGRRIFGDLVPYGELWRTGADEPTTLHLPARASLAGVPLRRGRYSLYTIPDPREWTLVINRSIRQEGRTREEVGRRGRRFPDAYTPVVRAAEVARIPVESSAIEFVEQFTVSVSDATAQSTTLCLDWETTRVLLPLDVSP